MKLEQFKAAPALTLVDMLMDAMTNNTQDAIYALRREYDFELKNLDRPEGDVFEFDGVEYIVNKDGDKLYVNARFDGWFRKLCVYDKTSKQLLNEQATIIPIEPVVAEGPACTAMESKVSEQIEHNIAADLREAEISYTPGDDIEDEVKEAEKEPPTATDSDEEIVTNEVPIGTPIEIPETPVSDAVEEPAEPSNNVRSLDDHSPTEYIKLLFGDQFVTWLDVRTYLWNNDYRDAAYKLTGTIPVEHCVIYDDYTFSIINLNNGSCFRVMVAVTDDELEQHEFLQTCDMPDRWMLVADISNNTAFNYGNYQEIVRSADWGKLTPGTMINL